MRPRSLLSATSVVALTISALGFGCIVGAPDRPAGQPEPPEPLSEQRYAAPAPGMVWLEGSWHWDGVEYVWIPGRWETAPPVPGN